MSTRASNPLAHYLTGLLFHRRLYRLKILTLQYICARVAHEFHLALERGAVYKLLQSTIHNTQKVRLVSVFYREDCDSLNLPLQRALESQSIHYITDQDGWLKFSLY